MSRIVGIVGVGHVGAHCAFSLCTQGICDEIVLVDKNMQKAVSENMDLLDCLKYLPHRIKIHVGDYASLKNCDIVVICVGVHNNAGCEDIQHRSRLQGLQSKLDMIDGFVPQIVDAGFKGIFIVITNPCDIIAYHIWQISGFDKSRVFATGTMLDSARLCQVLSRETGYDHKSIIGYMIGEHGDSEIPVWSHVSLGGKPLFQLKSGIDKDGVLKEVRKAAWNIADGKGATEFGISTVLSKLVASIFYDEKAMYPLSTLLEGQYNMNGLFISIPCIIGKSGIERTVELDLPDDELKGFCHSCEVIKKYC